MKKLLMMISIIFIVNISSAEVCWENGVPLYEGNFIYREKSTVTPIGNIYITWAELDNGYRKLKLQKTNSVGESIWNEPITLDQNDFMLETNITLSGDDGCFINAYNQSRSSQKLYKIDSNGNVLWQYSHDASYYINLLPLDNGSILKTEIIEIDNTYYIEGSYLSNSGAVFWENLQLFEFGMWNSLKILEQQFVDGYFYFLLAEGENCFLIKVNEAGELLNQSDSFSIGNYNSSKFINNSFFVFYINTETDDLEMHNFDLAGNSILAEDPKIISNTYGWKADDFTFSENYFYAIISDANEYLVFHKCNFEGEIMNTFIHSSEIFYHNLQVYDQEVDFVSCYGYTPTFDAYLLTLNENSISEPIYYLPESNINAWCEKYYLDDNFSFVGYGNIGDKEIYTMRKTEESTIVNTIRDIEYEIINPKLAIKNSNLASFWYSSEHHSLMIQEYDENGNPQYPANGTELIEGIRNFRIIEDKIYDVVVSSENSTATIDCYDLNGEHLWSEQFTVSDGPLYEQCIYPFYDGYLFLLTTITLDPSSHVLEYIAFDENGLLWSETETLEVANVIYFNETKMKGNNIFFKYNDIVYDFAINSDGTYTDPIILANNSDMIYTYGNENNFFAITRDGTTSLREFHYFQDGVLMWDEAWSVSIGDYGNLHTIFEDDGFYLIGFNYPDSVNIDKFDYAHNLIVESSFDYTSQNPIISGFEIYKQSDKFIFVFNSMLSNYDHQFSYMITDNIGNILVPEFSETIMERELMEFSNSTIFADNCVFMPIACGYKPFEGEYQRNYYIQKIDFSDYVHSEENEIISSANSLYCYPNPFNPSTIINFSIPIDSNVELSIFNIKGQKVKNLVSDDFEKGNHSVVWLGNNEADKRVSSGIYFYKIVINGKKELSKKCLLLK